MSRRSVLLVCAVILSAVGVFAVPAGAATAGSTSCPAVAIGENAQHSGHTCSVLSTSPVKRWAKTLNGYPSEPLIAGSRVFVTTTDPAGSGGWLYGLSRTTGKTLWGPVPLASVYHWFPLAYDNGRVFVNNFEGNLRAFDATTGRMLWMQQTGAFGGQPVATAGRVYVHGGYSVSALRETTGTRVWATKYLDGDGSTVGVDGTGVYVSTGCQSRFRLSLSTGGALWRGNPGCSGGGGGTAALWSGRMYASDGYFVLDMATGHTLGGFAGTPAFNGSRGYFAIGTAVFAEDVSTQTPKWTVDLGEPIIGTPVTTGNGLLVVITAAGHVIALNGTTGTRVFTRTVAAPVQSGQFSGNTTGISIGETTLIAPAGKSLVAFS